MTHLVPYLTERGQIWSKVERARRRFSEYGKTTQAATNTFGRAGDFVALEASSEKQFAADCAGAVARNVPLSPPVAALIADAKRSGSRVMVVAMPLSPTHKTRFCSSPQWLAYRAHVESLVKTAGGEFVVASDWVPDADDFADNLHLNEAGAVVYSTRIGRYVGNIHSVP